MPYLVKKLITYLNYKIGCEPKGVFFGEKIKGG